MRQSLISIIAICSLIICDLNAQVSCGEVQDFLSIKPESSTINSCLCLEIAGDCSGERVWSNGVKYSGNFKNGEINGEGKMTFGDEDFYYKGSFENGVPHGYGKMHYEDNSKYEGYWEHGKKVGQGAYVFSCGDEYLGEFKNDQINGNGVIIITNGSSYAGNWKDGLAHGEGTFTYDDGNKFMGTFNLGERHGTGIMAYVTEDTLFGHWIKGALDGKSVTKLKKGSSITNTWKNGVLEKKIVYQTSNGFKLSGSNKQLANIIQMSNKSLSDEGSLDFSMGWYVIAMEYKSRNEFDEAIASLQHAQQFDNTLLLESPVVKLINNELLNIASIKESTRMAKIK